MNPNFIGQYMIDDVSICDALIDVYFKSDIKHIGTVGDKELYVPEHKKSTEISLSLDTTLINSAEDLYLQELTKCCNKYKNEYTFSASMGNWKIIENYKIQHYRPGEGYYVWHAERGNASELFRDRHLVWMTYLNDVDDEGETEFYYQGIKVKPRKGLTLIWPADWTHTHHGITSPTQDKFIITGWYSYYNE